MSAQPGSLRALLEARSGIIIPGCYHVLSAQLIEEAGFVAASLSGFAVSATLGLGDGGQLARSDMIQRTDEVARSVRIPLLVDGDDGYGDATVIGETVRQFQEAGAGGLHIDDQWLPRSAGSPKKLISLEVMQSKIAAATAARTSSDLAIIGRTDAVSTNGFDEALRRARALEEAGADAVMIMYLTEREQVVRAARALSTPLVLAVTETARKSFRADELAGAGHAAIIYPVSSLLVSLAAQRAVLAHLAAKGDTEGFLDRMMPMSEVRRLAGGSG